MSDFEEGPPLPAPRPPAVGLVLRLALGARGDAIDKYLMEVHQRTLDRIKTAWSAAVQESGSSEEVLLATIAADEELSDLFGRVVEIALRTRWTAKLITLGKVLAQGVHADGDTELSESEAIETALAGLQPIHARVLAEARAAAPFNPGPNAGTGGLADWIVSRFPGTTLRSHEVAAYLTSRGLITEPFYQNGVISLTPLGLRMLELIETAGDRESPHHPV